MIWYSGHGQQDTGNWCFSDDILTFDEIWELYMTLFQGQMLCIVTDCCYSGQWVHRLAGILDKMRVPACGHQATERNILLKIFASCQPEQKAHDPCYSTTGVYYNDKEEAILFPVRKQLQPDQTTCGLDTTKVCCNRSPNEACQFCHLPANSQWTWRDLIDGRGIRL